MGSPLTSRLDRNLIRRDLGTVNDLYNEDRTMTQFVSTALIKRHTHYTIVLLFGGPLVAVLRYDSVFGLVHICNALRVVQNLYTARLFGDRSARPSIADCTCSIAVYTGSLGSITYLQTCHTQSFSTIVSTWSMMRNMMTYMED